MTDFNCPECKNEGMKIQKITPRTLLKPELKSKIFDELDYKYCRNSECEIIYFSRDVNQTFNKNDIVKKATIKDHGLDVNVCYCFNHTRQSVLDEYKETGKTTVLEDVKAKMKDPGCFCETSNPQGNCCLSNIKEWVTEIEN